MPDRTPEQDQKIEEILGIIRENQKVLGDLVIVIKGYNGFKGIAQTVQENTEKIIAIQACMDGLERIPELVNNLETKVAEFKTVPGLVKTLETKVTDLRNKPGDNALKWFTRIGVALLSALCIGLITYLFTMHSVQMVPVDPNTPHSQHVLPSTQSQQP